ncbi:MAG: hypothetical protein Fur0037_14610 [Planctomycetota bacterium]
MDLSAIPFRATSRAGISLHVYSEDERTGRIVALIAMEAGCRYPAHRHIDEERVLVLRGGYEDEFGKHREGDSIRYKAGTSHSPRALPGGTCVLLALARKGVEVLAR